ncbi:hypothetical protein [Lysobacter auxotrophicus]|uniref:Uncharacterized protein n=1 Tax=Lysobacter auxotrophicus TaxID=2992573 RepID=A0ABM8DFS7_9GAMM|nr:hypothetical protein [Lysobacter auxotrophicus]BDU17452.1 hypothetical protein LA521A_26530 [Lysobacter auxotrophicus]
MATAFPFSDRRQRPEVMGTGAFAQRPAAKHDGKPDAGSAAPSQHTIDPARAPARGHSYVDFASVTEGQGLPHRDVLG